MLLSVTAADIAIFIFACLKASPKLQTGAIFFLIYVYTYTNSVIARFAVASHVTIFCRKCI